MRQSLRRRRFASSYIRADRWVYVPQYSSCCGEFRIAEHSLVDARKNSHFWRVPGPVHVWPRHDLTAYWMGQFEVVHGLAGDAKLQENIPGPLRQCNSRRPRGATRNFGCFIRCETFRVDAGDKISSARTVPPFSEQEVRTGVNRETPIRQSPKKHEPSSQNQPVRVTVPDDGNIQTYQFREAGESSPSRVCDQWPHAEQINDEESFSSRSPQTAEISDFIPSVVNIPHSRGFFAGGPSPESRERTG